MTGCHSPIRWKMCICIYLYMFRTTPPSIRARSFQKNWFSVVVENLFCFILCFCLFKLNYTCIYSYMHAYSQPHNPKTPINQCMSTYLSLIHTHTIQHTRTISWNIDAWRTMNTADTYVSKTHTSRRRRIYMYKFITITHSNSQSRLHTHTHIHIHYFASGSCGT